MNRNRVVVTGLGVASSIGMGIHAFFEAMVKGQSGVKTIELFDPTDYRTKTAAYISDIKKGEHVEDRAYQIVDVICDELLNDAELDLKKIDKTKIGVCLGSCLGNVDSIDRYFESQVRLSTVSVKEILQQPHFMPAKRIADKYELEGVCVTVDTACASGTNSIGIGFEWVRDGKLDLVIAGGVDPFSRLSQSGFGGLMSLSPSSCKPFTKGRDGLVLGEAGAIVLLETLESALKRNAKIYAEVVGIGLSTDAFHETKPDPKGEGASRAIKACLKDANVNIEEIDYINAHGTGTPFNDAMEIKAINDLLNGTETKPKISSIKPMIGHCLGAAGSIEFIATVFAIHKKVVPPTLNFDIPIDGFEDWDFIPNKSTPLEKADVAISNSFAFGGNSACIALRKYIN